MATAKLENVGGYPAIVIDGKAYPPMMATIRHHKDGALVIDDTYYKKLSESGIKLFFLICDTQWLKEDSFALFEEAAERLLAVVPDAYIFLRIGMHPPLSWMKENPDELVSYSDGKLKGAYLFTESYRENLPAMYSLCSQKWREDAGKALCDTYEEILKSKFSDRVAGFFFAAGGTSEWYYLTPTEYTKKSVYTDSGFFNVNHDTDYDNVYADLSPAFRRQFSKYLKEKYKTNDNLKKAWKCDDADIDNPKIPDCTGRYYVNGVDYDLANPGGEFLANSSAPLPPSNGTNVGVFLDINKNMDVFDFYRAWHKGVAESVVYFGNVIKSLNKDMLTGAFYGSAGSCKFFSFGQSGAVKDILNSGKIDFLASPGVYENREPGGFTGQRQVFDSFRLSNTMFVVEDDARTHHENAYYKNSFSMFDINDSENVLKREFGRNICQDTQAWWFDQHIGGGRYKDEEIYKLFKRQSEIAKLAYSKDRVKNSEIAFIYDEESLHIASAETSNKMVELFRNYETDIVGAPSDRYYHDDMANPNMPDYKLYVFVNTFYLTDKQREVIHKKLKKNHATALFMFGSGFVNPDKDEKLSAKHMSELTKIDIKMENKVVSGKWKVNKNSDIFKNLDFGTIYGDFTKKMMPNASSRMNDIRKSRADLYPFFYADDKDAEGAAYFCDNTKCAVAVKETGDFVSVYYGSTYLSANVLCEIARLAGCHIYCGSNDVLYANKHFITFHASSGGKKEIYLPCKADAYELYENRYFARNSSVIRFECEKGKTYMFYFENPLENN